MTESEKQNKDIVLRFNKEVLEQGNTGVIDELVDPEFVNHTMPESPKGPEGLVDFIANVLHKALKNIEVEIHDQVVEDDKVVTRKTIRGIHADVFMGIKPSMKEVEIQIIDIIRLKNGKYTEHWSIRDARDVINKSEERQ